MAPADESRDLIDRYLAAYNAFDVPGMLLVVHPDVEFQNVSGGVVTASARGHEEFRQLAKRAATLFASRRQTVVDYGREGERAWIAVEYQGKLAADLGPGLRAGDTLRLTGRSTFEFRDGLIARLIDES